MGAYASIECGYPYIASLPMPFDEYRKDFKSKKSLEEFNELIAKADCWHR